MIVSWSATLAGGCVEGDEMRAISAPATAAVCGRAESPGRLCGCVYDAPVETHRLPDFAALAPIEMVCVDSLNVTLRKGAPGFPGITSRYEWFGVDFQGTLFVGEPGPITLRLTSDDGAKLIVDDALVLNNDGLHDIRSVAATVALASGPHRIRIPYWDGPGPMALTLEAARPGSPFSVVRFDRSL